jgi:hypothetical protein
MRVGDQRAPKRCIAWWARSFRSCPKMAFTSSGTSVAFWFGDLYFCGAQTVGVEATVLGIVYPGTAPQQVPAPLLTADDCKNEVRESKEQDSVTTHDRALPRRQLKHDLGLLECKFPDNTH